MEFFQISPNPSLSRGEKNTYNPFIKEGQFIFYLFLLDKGGGPRSGGGFAILSKKTLKT